MNWKYIILNICVVCSAVFAADEESPGFFLKISKNVPRLGRRGSNSNDDFFLKGAKTMPRIGRSDPFVDSGISFDDRIPSWYEQYMNPSKRVLGGNVYDDHLAQQSAYRKVQPFDSNFLFNIIANEHINNDDFKFVSWKDFDIALESDNDLYDKLVSLAKGDKDMPEYADKINIQQFVPMEAGGTRYKEGSGLFYRSDRRAENDPNSRQINFNKEKIAYQMK